MSVETALLKAMEEQRKIDPIGLKEGGKIVHFIDNKSAIKIGLAMFGSSLALLIIGEIIKAFKK